MQKFHVVYNIDVHPEGITNEEVPEGQCAASALILTSLLHMEDGSTGYGLQSVDGRTGDDMADEELFSAWCIMARRLADSETLSEGKKEMAELVFEGLRTAVLAARKAHEREPS